MLFGLFPLSDSRCKVSDFIMLDIYVILTVKRGLLGQLALQKISNYFYDNRR